MSSDVKTTIINNGWTIAISHIMVILQGHSIIFSLTLEQQRYFNSELTKKTASPVKLKFCYAKFFTKKKEQWKS